MGNYSEVVCVTFESMRSDMKIEYYTSELDEGDRDYEERAKEFLLNLFQYQIRHMEFYKRIQCIIVYYIFGECMGRIFILAVA